MKRKVFIFTSILVVLVALSACLVLVGCNGMGLGGLPSSKLDKITFAFKGVEKSLTNQKAYTADNSANGLNWLFVRNVAAAEETAGVGNTSNVDVLIDLCDESNSVTEPEFKYDEPPMIQFQYIKALYEKVGADYVGKDIHR